jgi:hypothetical protein
MVMDMMTQGQQPPDAGPPPDLAAALGAGPAAGGPPAGPQDTGQPPDQGAAPGDPVEIVTQMLEMGKTYLDTEEDHEDLLAMQKILTELQNLLTKDQQDADKAMQGNVSPRILRKAGV